MANIQCLYCGQEFPDNLSECPSCQAPSHFRKNDWSADTKKRFVGFVILVAIFCAFMIVYLPR